MVEIPDELKYSETHEWVRVEGEHAVVGITDHAQSMLENIVEIDFYKKVGEEEDDLEIGDVIKKGDEFGFVGSPKAGEPLFLPISLEISEINRDLIDNPEVIHEDPYGKGWMVKGKVLEPAEIESLMDAESYRAYSEKGE